MQTNLPKQVPFLPGHVFHDPYKQNYHKTQQFNFLDGSQQQKKQFLKEQIDQNLIDQMTKSLSNLSFLKTRKAPQNDYIPRIQPPWLKYDRKVLRFYGYFQEHVVQSKLQNYRIRAVQIYYYLSDQTIYVTQKKIQNSGIPQGVFLKRQKVPKVIGQLADHYTWKDLNIAVNINFFERIFRIYDCDAFTKQFYQYMQTPLNQPQQLPNDLYGTFLRVKDAKINPPDTKQYKQYIQVKLGGGHPNDGLKKYLQNDRKVLCFKLLWNDTTLEGGYNYFSLNYFLADDMVQVKEVRFQNSGKDPFPLLLKKQKLPKKAINTVYPGMNLKKQQYYSPNDFGVGEHINVFGRDCVVYDADQFTKAYFKYNLGREIIPLKIQQGQKRPVQHQIPPFNGYGTPEDSLGSVFSLQPKPPKKDMTKIFTNDQYVLRFQARLISHNKDENNRKFIISFFCGDDTIQVFQNADKNSGIWGGKFLQRKRHENKSEGRYLVDNDFQLGNIITLGVYNFQLLKGDDFTIQYMRQRPQKFPEVNVQGAFNKIKSLSKNYKTYDQFLIWFIKNIDPSNKGHIDYDEFSKNISKHVKLTNPELYTIYKFSIDKDILSMKKLFKNLGGGGN